MKVLIIDHMGVLPSEHKKYEELSRYEDIDLVALVPECWKLNFRRVYLSPDHLKKRGSYRIVAGKVFLAGRGGCSFYYTELLSILLKFRPDIIHLFQEPWSFFAFQTILLSNLVIPHRKIVFLTSENIYRDFSYPSLLSFFYSFTDKYTYRNADYAICISGEAKEVLIRKGFKRKIKIVPWGIDPDLFKKIKVGKLRERLNLENSFVIGCVGRLVKEKGILTLIEAASKLNYDYKILLVGSGPLKEAIIERAKVRGINNRLIVIETVTQAGLVKYYNCMDILVLPSCATPYAKEQFGRVLIEAMSCEVPVIGSNVGGIPGVIGNTGLVFKEKDADDLKEKMVKLIEETDSRIEFGKKGRKRVLENYTWSKYTKELHKVYQELV